MIVLTTPVFDHLITFNEWFIIPKVYLIFTNCSMECKTIHIST